MPTRPSDFRFIYANAVGLAISDHETRIMFALAEDMRKPSENTEQVGVIMNHQTAKWLTKVLSLAIEQYEVASGTTIPFDEERFEALKKSSASIEISDSTDN
jgi:Protein of unknown function (DUF3467)